MVDEVDTQELSCVHQLFRDDDICIARQEAARRMVVHENDRCGRVFKCWAEDFSWMHNVRINGSNRNDLVVDDLVVVVQVNSTQVFFRKIVHVFGMVENILCRADDFRT